MLFHLIFSLLTTNFQQLFLTVPSSAVCANFAQAELFLLYQILSQTAIYPPLPVICQICSYSKTRHRPARACSLSDALSFHFIIQPPFSGSLI